MKTTNKVQIELRDIDSVQPYEKNPRRNEETVQALERSIKIYGFNQPILIDTEGVIIKGHSRWRAAKNLGMEQIPVIVSTREDSANRADRILDNKIHELSQWNEELLHQELRDTSEEINAVLGSMDLEYAVQNAEKSISSDAVEKARSRLRKPQKDLHFIWVFCECGGEILVSREELEAING